MHLIIWSSGSQCGPWPVGLASLGNLEVQLPGPDLGSTEPETGGVSRADTEISL